MRPNRLKNSPMVVSTLAPVLAKVCAQRVLAPTANTARSWAGVIAALPSISSANNSRTFGPLTLLVWVMVFSTTLAAV